ncbi:hypothetical protein [Mycobacterium tuberculosis]|nr:hypothetical protein [Mycobacterium tuberculosis]
MEDNPRVSTPPTVTSAFWYQSAEVWSDAGQLLASTHQMVYFKE